MGVLARLRCSTKETIPPLYRSSCFFWLLSSSIVMRTPLFKKASSRRRWERISKLKSRLSKIFESGRKVIRVPLSFDLPTSLSGPWGSPRAAQGGRQIEREGDTDYFSPRFENLREPRFQLRYPFPTS